MNPHPLLNTNIVGHIYAGLFFWIVGALALLEAAEVGPRSLRFFWKLLAMFVGLVGLSFNESTLWPTGSISWLETLSHPEVLHHRMVSLGVLTAGTVELLRSAGVLKPRAWSFVFACVSSSVGVLLLFHPAHSGADVDLALQFHQHVADSLVANAVLFQHRLMAAVCFLIALTFELNEYGRLHRRSIQFVWPFLTMLLGTLLIAYRE